MKTNEAVNRLKFTLSKENKPNETDKIALNSLITYINKNDAETVQNNYLFAKIYTFCLTELLSYYGDINFANKQLNKELNVPLSYHIEKLEMRLKTFEIENFFKSKGIIDRLLTAESVERYKNLFPEININEFLQTTQMWCNEDVISHLNRNITESLINYKNV